MSALTIKQKAIIGLSAVVIASLPTKAALAWHPKGVIKKEVMNVTQGIAYSDANTTGTAVQAAPGDTLKYRITVSNIAEPASREWNDLHYVVMTDKLPKGVTYTTTEIKENMGLILPKKSVVREYEVKVAANTEGNVINTACFTGNSKVNDNPQKGCDDAWIKVTKPVVPETPEEPETPVPTPEEPEGKGGDTPVTLPETGTGALIGSLAGISGLAFATRSYLQSRRGLRNALKSNR